MNDIKQYKKILIGIGIIALICLLFGGIKGVMELVIFLLVVGVIWQMFFSKKQVKQYDPRDYDTPGYDKNSYQTPLKEENSYTPAPPTGEPKPYSETHAVETFSKAFVEDENTTILGYDVTSKHEFKVYDEELNGMCLLLGATGAGKTTAIKTLLERPLKYQDPIIIVDGKGSPSFPEDIEKMCKKYNRNFKLFSVSNAAISKHYSSLRHGGFTELKDKIISIFDWSEEHYKLQAERFLQGVFKFLLLPEVKELLQVQTIDLKTLSQCLSVDTLKSMIESVGEKGDFLSVILNEVEESAAKGLANRINSICESELSELFIDTQDPNVIDLLQSIENNDVVFFSLDSLKFPEYTRMLGRLIIADMKCVSPRFYGRNKRIYSVFDEFNVFASEIIVNLINKTREYGFRNIIGTQELADMVINGDSKLLNQILGNTNVKIALRQDVHSSCEEISNMLNTKDIYKPTISIGEQPEGMTPQGSKINTSLSKEEEFLYKSREISQLERGEAIVFTKFPQFRHAKIKIRKV